MKRIVRERIMISRVEKTCLIPDNKIVLVRDGGGDLDFDYLDVWYVDNWAPGDTYPAARRYLLLNPTDGIPDEYEHVETIFMGDGSPKHLVVEMRLD